MDELAAMIEEHRTEPSMQILEAFEAHRLKASRLRPPRWAESLDLDYPTGY